MQGVLPPGIDASAVVQARLRLFVTRVASGSAVRAAVTSSDWDEATVNASVSFPTGISSMGTIPPAMNSIVLDVSRAVQQAVNQNQRYLAFVLDADGSLFLDSKESISTSQPAALEVTIALEGHQGPAGPQGPQGPQGATGPAGPRGPEGPSVTANTTWVSQDVKIPRGLTIYEANAFCSASYPKVLTGGCQIPQTGTYNDIPLLVTSTPTTGYPNGWHCLIWQSSANPAFTATAKALCSK